MGRKRRRGQLKSGDIKGTYAWNGGILMTPPMTLLSHPKDMAPKQAYTHVSFYFSLMGLGSRDLVLIHMRINMRM